MYVAKAVRSGQEVLDLIVCGMYGRCVSVPGSRSPFLGELLRMREVFTKYGELWYRLWCR